MPGCFVFAAVFDSTTARERERIELNLERERERWFGGREGGDEPALALAVMEPDLQPLTVYNEHPPPPLRVPIGRGTHSKPLGCQRR